MLSPLAARRKNRLLRPLTRLLRLPPLRLQKLPPLKLRLPLQKPRLLPLLTLRLPLLKPRLLTLRLRLPSSNRLRPTKKPALGPVFLLVAARRVAHPVQARTACQSSPIS
ncbi:conserved exported hypothetical protein [Cupriavidus oxalaticus]|uniref:Uncharacterized protein n=1 Tax=Cupriavidus oxalaticus TaxID=96344 RepID=A0A375GEN7_9BURK|nr:conserved exported hypothetical protein [Cupriavidus oxalaticus]